MTRREKRMAGIIVLALGVAVAAGFTLTAFRKNLMNFYTPTDLIAGTVPAGARMRLGGLVERGSLKRGDGLRVQFMLADCVNRVPVQFEGILPDLFREGQGIVANGEMGADRVFVATEVLAKHDENYMPPTVAKSLKGPNGHACAPFKSMAAPAS